MNWKTKMTVYHKNISTYLVVVGSPRPNESEEWVFIPKEKVTSKNIEKIVETIIAWSNNKINSWDKEIVNIVKPLKDLASKNLPKVFSIVDLVEAYYDKKLNEKLKDEFKSRAFRPDKDFEERAAMCINKVFSLIYDRMDYGWK